MEGHWKNAENTLKYVGQCQGDTKGCWASSKKVCETLGKVKQNLRMSNNVQKTLGDIKKTLGNDGGCLGNIGKLLNNIGKMTRDVKQHKKNPLPIALGNH